MKRKRRGADADDDNVSFDGSEDQLSEAASSFNDGDSFPDQDGPSDNDDSASDSAIPKRRQLALDDISDEEEGNPYALDGFEFVNYFPSLSPLHRYDSVTKT